MKITNVRVNGIENPIGYMMDKIEVSWNVENTDSRKQTSGLIEVASDPAFEKILLKKEGADLHQAGEKLALDLVPRTRYYLRITISGDAGDQGASEEAFFETGKMCEAWVGKWIAPRKEDTFHPVLRKTFDLTAQVKRARWYGTGVGLFNLYLNGRKVGDEYLTPYVNNYEDRIQVMTWEAEDLLREGGNEISIILGRGWYMGVFGLAGQVNNYGDRMATIGELHIEYADGHEDVIATDSSWQYQGSFIGESGIYYGEDYNRIRWENVENPLKPVEVLEHPENEEGTKNLRYDHLTDRLSIPVKHQETISVADIITTPSGDTVLDMGQNFAGWMVIKKALPRGCRVKFECAEILQDGEFYHGNYREARSEFIYTSDGVEENVHPHFTFFGFRYLRVTGWPGEITKNDVEGWALYSDMRRTGCIETADEKINRLYENTLWGQRSNFIDMPTDCPQRNERLGWTGDAQVFAPTASYHYDTRAFYHKFARDLHEEQAYIGGGVPNFLPNLGHDPSCSSVWGDIATFLPNTIYQFFGSEEELRLNYPMMKDWVEWIHRQDVARGEKDLWDFGFTFGDWLALDGQTPTSFKGSTDDWYVSSVYYYQSAHLTAEAAALIGKPQDASDYADLAGKIRKAVLEEFFTPTGRLAINTQAALIIALKFGIYIDKQKIIDQFKARLKFDMNRIKCGFVGAPLMTMVMAENGMFEEAYDLLLNESFPGWLYEVNMGATTIWERWNSVGEDGHMDPAGMNSLNHYSYGSVMEFVYAYLVGIREDAPGFTHAVIAPHPDVRIPWMRGRYESVSGTYVASWKIEADGTFAVHIEIPFNCSATVELPYDPDGVRELGTGTFDFRYMPTKDLLTPYSENTPLKRLAQDDRVLTILGKYVPPVAGMAMGAKNGNEEVGSNTLADIRGMFYMGFDPKKLEEAIGEICGLKAEI